MSTPTTAKFQILVPSTEENGGAEQLYTLTLQAAMDSSEIQMSLLDNGDSVTPQGDIPLPKDPPKAMEEDGVRPMGDIPLPKDPPKAMFQITVPPTGETVGVYTLELSVQVEGSESDEIAVTPIDDVPAEPLQGDLEIKAA